VLHQKAYGEHQFLGKFYYIRSRLPMRYNAVNGRRIIKTSLHTDSELLTISKVGKFRLILLRLGRPTQPVIPRMQTAALKRQRLLHNYLITAARDVITKPPRSNIIKWMREVMETSLPSKPDLVFAGLKQGSSERLAWLPHIGSFRC